MSAVRRAALAVAVLVLAPLVPAWAGGQDQPGVSSGGARVVYRTAPFALSVLDAAGHPVLHSVDGAAGGPGAAVDPAPLGGTPAGTATTRYAPVVFEVGGKASPQFPAGPYEGNLITGAGAGQQYAATSVQRVSHGSQGALDLVLGTDDPTGRTVRLHLAPRGTGAVALSARVEPTAGVSALALSFASGPDEGFHGFGGRHNAVDQHGQELVQYTQEENQGAGPLQPVADAVPGGGGGHYLFPNGPTAAYYVQNSFVSSRGYGFLLDRTELSRFRLDSDRPDAWQVAVTGAATDAVIAPGTPLAATSTLTALTGRHRVPPAWAVGPTLYRGVRVLSTSNDTAASYEAKVRDDIAHIDRDHLGVTAYALEGWTLLPPDVLRDLIGQLRRRGIHPLVYLRAYISQDGAGTERSDTFPTAVANGYLTRTAAGTPYLFGSSFVAGVAGLLDFTNPAAKAWWQGRVREVLDLGADGFMEDFGEQVLSDMRFYDGSTGDVMHNRYGVLYHAATRAVFDQYAREHPERGCCFDFTRTGFTGTPGTAATENANFPGDETTEFAASSGLASIVPDMLNRSVGGLYGYTTDIGGYLDQLTGSPNAELFTRWTQASALMPFFRVHNSSSTGVRMPWSYDQATLDRYRAMAELHRRFEPYILASWQHSAATGVPLERPLWLAAPEAPGARTNADEWLLGDDVLVAPVLSQGATARQVSLPAGCWRAGGTGPELRGPGTVVVPSPIDTLPWFARCGARLPR